ncbi:hypothetical protein K469DRAFT_679342 [Zopfia rhizophila CBS 207.26]|uniref:Transposase Tc1-like domain-containing protein n=1 Tax=Zopfia rhizophila CBS 207.26 TaxID=1314779 RepID=A0A6A6DCI3_9PEZI|nr:hypothetical protein K469DRAFT_679342 [Zopfia rhizophila CBS 207.26]
MPPLRTPLGPISGNRRFNHELTPYQRGIAIGLKLAGAKSKDIQVDLNISRGALRSTLSLNQLRNQGVSQARIGAPKSYIEAEERKLIRHVRLHPKDTYAQVKKACTLRCGKTTIKKILKEYGIIN